MTIQTRRAYEPPGPDDGERILVDRVWPRGRSREALAIDDWLRDVGPSDALRRWFGHDPARWQEFRRRYREELREDPRAALVEQLAHRARTGRVTLVYGARDEAHNQAVALAEVIEERLGE